MISYVLKNDRYEMKVPALTFGAAGFERNDCDDVYFEFLDKYVELGGWCIDTARVYCDWLENGHDSSEGVIGRWLKARNNRDKICIATKGGHPEMGHMDESRLSREELTKDLEESLKVLGVDYVDIYYHHRPDPETPLEETARALDGIVRSGKALYVGISNYNKEQTIEIAKLFKEMGTPFIINQRKYSMFDRTIETDGLKDYASKNGIGIITFCPLAQGLLTDRYLHGIPQDSRIRTDGRFLKENAITEETLAKINALNEIAKKRGESLAQMALAWILRDGDITSVLIGASKPAQILDNIGMLNAPVFTEEERAKIDEICGK